MATTEIVTDLLNSLLGAVKTVLPTQSETRGDLILVEKTYQHSSLGVLIALVGDVSGRIVFDAVPEAFASMAQLMYGMSPEGSMLESFAGEMGNVVAGTAVSDLATRGQQVSISTPTVLVGQAEVGGFRQGIHVPIHLDNVGDFNIVLIMD